MKNLCWKGTDTVIFAPDLVEYAFRRFLFRCEIYGRRVLKSKHNLLMFAPVKLLVFAPLFNTQK